MGVPCKVASLAVIDESEVEGVSFAVNAVNFAAELLAVGLLG